MPTSFTVVCLLQKVTQCTEGELAQGSVLSGAVIVMYPAQVPPIEAQAKLRGAKEL